MNSQEIKELAYSLGADLCGIASIDRFDEAPEGFHPTDVLSECKSVIVIARSFLAATMKSKSLIPYTVVRNTLTGKMDEMSVELCTILEKKGIIALPTGTIGPTEFDKKTGRYRNIISVKHAAVNAGLGVIGKNSLLITPEYGNMVWLSAIITEAELEADKLLENTFCNEKCHVCIDVCPSHALSENPEIIQTNCADYAMSDTTDGGDWRIKCYKCRMMCPHCFGSVNSKLMKK